MDALRLIDDCHIFAFSRRFLPFENEPVMGEMRIQTTFEQYKASLLVAHYFLPRHQHNRSLHRQREH
jgi:hypothetical protein